MKWTFALLLFIVFLFAPQRSASAQLFDESTAQIKYDTNYIRVYKDELTTRFYVSRKQNSYTISDRLLYPGLQYKTNDNLVLGLGYTYSFLTVNLGVKMPFINKDDETYGSSKYVDLTTHTMFRNFLVDIYFQWSKGYYFANPEEILPGWDMTNSVPLRGDLRTSLVGINVQYLFNSDRFSYKAAFLQNEFQRKSAGSPIVGIDAYWMLGMADSLIVPPLIRKVRSVDQYPFNQLDQVNIGVNGGYAYTFVWDERFSASLAFMVGLSGGYHLMHSTEESTTYSKGLTVGANNLARISIGYNSHKHYVGLSYVRFTMSGLVGSPNGDWAGYTTGYMRVNFVKRFLREKPIKFLRPDLWTF